jgi:hypothetical protein
VKPAGGLPLGFWATKQTANIHHRTIGHLCWPTFSGRRNWFVVKHTPANRTVKTKTTS